MLRQYTQSFLEKQKGKSFSALSIELAVRLLSVIIFPCAYGLLAICSIIRPIRFGFLYHERLGHLALNTDLYLRRRHLGLSPQNEVHIFFVYEPANQQLVKMFARKIILVNSAFLTKIMAPFGLLHTRFWLPLPFMGCEYMEFNSAPPQIEFTAEESERGQKFLLKVGLDNDSWYACIFARDHRYYKIFSPNTDVAFSDHRNADIDTFELAIKAILDAGGWVIRMGSCVEKPLKFKHPRVIDYASSYREDFLDVYITSKARLFIGTTSGASDMAVLFDVPFVGVNWVPIGYAPFGKNSIFIPKRIASLKSGNQVSMREQLSTFIGNQVSAAIVPEALLKKRGWYFVDNTPNEILDAVTEQLQRLDGCFESDDAYRSALHQYAAILPEDNIYRSNHSPIAREMLLSMNLNAVERLTK